MQPSKQTNDRQVGGHRLPAALLSEPDGQPATQACRRQAKLLLAATRLVGTVVPTGDGVLRLLTLREATSLVALKVMIAVGPEMMMLIAQLRMWIAVEMGPQSVPLLVQMLEQHVAVLDPGHLVAVLECSA